MKVRSLLFTVSLLSVVPFPGARLLASPTAVPPPPDRPVVLTSAFIAALVEFQGTNSPALQAAAARTAAARASEAAVRTWEDPMVMVGGMFADEMMRADEGDLLYGVQQKLPLFGRPGAMRRLAAREADVMAADQEMTVQQRRSELARALFRAAYWQQAARVGTEDLVWIDGMIAAAEARYRAGEASQAQVLRLQNERAMRAEGQVTEERRVLEVLATVNRLLAISQDTAWPRLELPPVAEAVSYGDALVSLALTNEPGLFRLREQVRMAEAAVDVTRRSRHPEVAVGAEGRNYTGDGEFRQAMVTLSVSLPWLNDGKYRQDLRRETARRQATELDLAEQELAVREEVLRLSVGLDAARREALLFRDQVVPRSRQALASAEAVWRAGPGSFLEVMEARRQLLDARLREARAVVEQHQMLAELVLCCGLGDPEALFLLGITPEAPSVPNP